MFPPFGGVLCSESWVLSDLVADYWTSRYAPNCWFLHENTSALIFYIEKTIASSWNVMENWIIFHIFSRFLCFQLSRLTIILETLKTHFFDHRWEVPYRLYLSRCPSLLLNFELFYDHCLHRLWAALKFSEKSDLLYGTISSQSSALIFYLQSASRQPDTYFKQE